MQFEYKTVVLKEKGVFVTKFNMDSLNEELEKNGKEGWDLVSSFATDLDNNGKKEVILIFKRALDEFV